MDIPIIHADDRYIVVDKPAGLLSQPGVGPDKHDSLVIRLKKDFPGVRIVHRLDRDTSGVMVLALDADAHRNLSMQFQNRHVSKRYEAIVHGVVHEDEGEVDLPIARDPVNKPRQMIDHQHGRPSQTRWRVAERLDGCTRVELFPITGRSHQLRIHMRELDHPIIGDELYAPHEVQQKADRLLLHAAMLMIINPGGGERMVFESPVPF